MQKPASVETSEIHRGSQIPTCRVDSERCKRFRRDTTAAGLDVIHVPLEPRIAFTQREEKCHEARSIARFDGRREG